MIAGEGIRERALTRISVSLTLRPVSGADLARHRTRLGLTQTELAARLGVHAMTVSKWERAEHRIPAAVAKLVATFKPKGGARGKR